MKTSAVTPLRVLLAEDTPANQMLLVRILEGRGHSVLVAEDGLAAVRTHAREPFDLVLMDLHMPVMDGFEAAEQIRKSESDTGRHIPIVAVTAYASLESRTRCLAAGMDTFIAKPIDIPEFLTVIESFTPLADRGRSEPGIDRSSAPRDC